MKTGPIRSLSEFKRQIETNQKIALIAHSRPDTDAIGSLVALKKLIDQNFEGKIVDIFADTDKPDELFTPILKNNILNEQRAPRYDLAIALDSPSLERLGKYEKLFIEANDTVNIDHHITNQKFAYNNLTYETSSTCEVIYILFNQLKIEIPESVCKVIYAGMVTDTANFTIGNMRPSTFKILTHFTNKKLPLDEVNAYFFKNNSVSKAKLLERALHSMKLICRGKVAVMKLTKADFEETGAKLGDEEGIVNQGINTKGVNIAMIIIKRDNNLSYFSLRGKGGANVAEIAKQFGGGGHETMAAFTYSGNQKDINPKLVEAFKKELEHCENVEKTDDLFFKENEENLEL